MILKENSYSESFNGVEWEPKAGRKVAKSRFWLAAHLLSPTEERATKAGSYARPTIIRNINGTSALPLGCVGKSVSPNLSLHRTQHTT